MRFDINILWIDDSPDWQKEQQELFELNIDGYGLLYHIEYNQNADKVIERLSNEAGGFKVYDMIFVDYNISNTLQGNQIIDRLRNKDIDADVLFYSAQAVNDLKKIIFEGNGAFEGIYIANRDSFQDKAVSLYKKNIRNLLSLSNIRGFLADKTSENDYVVNSYILRNFDKLSSEIQNDIRASIQNMVNTEQEKQTNKMEDYNKIIGKEEININKLLGLPSYILTLEAKYAIFEAVLKAKSNTTFNEHSITAYLNEIVKKRNTVAHQKLDVCKQQKYIKHFDNINQYNRNACPDDCSGHTDERKISLEEWLGIVKLTNIYSRLFDKIALELASDDLITVS